MKYDMKYNYFLQPCEAPWKDAFCAIGWSFQFDVAMGKEAPRPAEGAQACVRGVRDDAVMTRSWILSPSR